MPFRLATTRLRPLGHKPTNTDLTLYGSLSLGCVTAQQAWLLLLRSRGRLLTRMTTARSLHRSRSSWGSLFQKESEDYLVRIECPANLRRGCRARDNRRSAHAITCRERFKRSILETQTLNRREPVPRGTSNMQRERNNSVPMPVMQPRQFAAKSDEMAGFGRIPMPRSPPKNKSECE